MWELITLPFRLVWGALSIAWNVVWGAVSLVFGVVGGIVSLVMGVVVIGLLVGLISHVCKQRKETRQEDTASKTQEDFVSYYDKHAVK